MKKISGVKLIEFNRRLKDASKLSFLNNQQKDKKKEDGKKSGGDYWISTISAVRKSFEVGNLQPILDKRLEITSWLRGEIASNTRVMYKANIDLLKALEEFDFKLVRPSGKLTFFDKPEHPTILTYDGVDVQVQITTSFIIEETGVKTVGSICFAAKKGGFNLEELALLSNLLFDHLTVFYGSKYRISEANCIAVDLMKQEFLSLKDAKLRGIRLLLPGILDQVKRMLGV